MRMLKVIIGAVALVGLSLNPAVAASGGKSGAAFSIHAKSPSHPTGSAKAGPTKGPSSGPSMKSTGPKSSGPKSTGPKSSGPKSSGPKSTGPGSAKSKAPVTAGASAKNTGGGSSKKPSTTSTAPAVTAATTTVNFTATPVGEKLTKNTALQSKLAAKLDALGYQGTVFEAVYGFKNLGQAVAATNIATNLDIPFELLKLQMTGISVDAEGNVLRANLAPDGTVSLVDAEDVTNPAPTKSLGQSIQTLKASVDATTAAQQATVQADAEIANTSSTAATTSSTNKSKKKS